MIPDAASAFGGGCPFGFDSPQALVIARGAGSNPFDTAHAVSSRIDRFLLLVRLLYAGTLEPFYEVRGETSPVRRFGPDLVLFRRSGLALIRRTTRLGGDDSGSVAALGELLDKLGFGHSDMVTTSFDMAVLKFTESYLGTPWYDQLVDLSTALEAALSGQDRQDVLLRARDRAAALLATPNDSSGHP